MAVTSIKRLRPDAATSVELIWKIPPPPLPVPRAQGSGVVPTLRQPAPAGTSAPALRPARPGVISSSMTSTMRPTMRDLAAAAREINLETSFERAAVRIEREALRLTGAAEVLCVAFDWAHRRAWTARGVITTSNVVELVADVAGRGRRTVIGSALVEPIGPAPSPAVLALRRRSGVFTPEDMGAIAGLISGVSQTLQRLLSARP